jgi:hypothetical protein
VILEDSKVRVSTRQLAPHQSFTITGTAPFGTVLIRSDGPGLCGDSKGGSRIVGNSDPCLIPEGKTATFENTTAHTVAMLLVNVMQEKQPLTVNKVVLGPGKEIEDASERNDTLLIAMSPVQLRELHNLADESTWAPTKPKILKLNPNAATWMPPGTYHLKNLLATTCSFVTLEW